MSAGGTTRLEIEHRSEFRYSDRVFLEPHTVRLRPRHSWRQWLRQFELIVDPAPEGRADNLGLSGDVEAHLWFSELTDHLRLTTRAVIDLPRTEPFAFLLDPGFLEFPVSYPAPLAAQAQPYLRRRHGDVAAIDAYAAAVARDAGGGVLPFLTGLARALWQDMDKTVREEGDPLTPAETLESRCGACRDLAELYVDACRSRRLAARFVSGYCETEVVDEVRYMHAWAEVFLPGAGWRGFDPTLGIAIGDRHVAVASGPSHVQARPYEGTFRGSGASARMEASIHMAMSAPPAM